MFDANAIKADSGATVMSIWELFSKREERIAKAGQEYVYKYTFLPNGLRVQIIYIMDKCIGQATNYGNGSPPDVSWRLILEKVRDEKGVFRLSMKSASHAQDECAHYIMDADAIDVIDLVEVSFHIVNTYIMSLG